MSDRLTELVLGLQRMAENARLRGEDLRYTQQQEVYDHIQWLDAQLGMVEKVRTALMEERKRFMPVSRIDYPDNKEHPNPTTGTIPKIVQQGPRKAEGEATR